MQDSSETLIHLNVVLKSSKKMTVFWFDCLYALQNLSRVWKPLATSIGKEPDKYADRSPVSREGAIVWVPKLSTPKWLSALLVTRERGQSKSQ